MGAREQSLVANSVIGAGADIRCSAREHLQYIVRDFFGTFRGAMCSLMPFCSHNGGKGAAAALRKVLDIKWFIGRSTEI